MQTTVVPPPAQSRFSWTLIARGDIQRSAPEAVQLRLPTLRLEETGGVGGRFEGYGIDVHYHDVNGRLQRFEIPSTSRPTWALLGSRYEGRSAFLLELRQGVEVRFVGSPHAPTSVVLPRPHDWLAYVHWTLVVRDDLGREGVVEVLCQPPYFDLGPGAT